MREPRLHRFIMALGLFLGMGILLSSVDGNRLHAQSTNSNCLQELAKVNKHYQDYYYRDKFKVNIKSMRVTDGVAGEWLSTDFWRNGDHYKFQNPYMLILIDAKNTVVVLEDSRAVVIKNTENKEGPEMNNGPELSVTDYLDSLREHAIQMGCSDSKGQGGVELIFEANGENSLVKASVTYESETGAIISTVYEYISREGGYLEITEYSNYSNTFDNPGLSKSALSHIFAKGEVQPKYKPFHIKDLRSNQSQ